MQAADLRVNNLATVLRSAVLAAEPRSRAEIAQDTGLAKPTVSSLVEQLLDAGLLTEGEAVHRGAGRPSIPLVPRRHGVVGIGLEITADHLGARAVDLQGATVVERTSPAPSSGVDPAVTIERAAALLADVLDAVAAHDISGVCVSVPGRLSADRSVVLSAPNLEWQDVPLHALLAGHPALAAHWARRGTRERTLDLHNDAHLAARFEIAQRDDGASFVYVFGETGIGGAIVIDGEVYPGGNGWAGEIGHVAVEVGGALCRCGRRGCLEAHASYHALRARARLGPEVPISEVVEVLASRLGDRRGVMEMIGGPLGYALSDTLNVLDLPTVVLGGYLAPIAHELEPVLRTVMRERSLAEEQGQVHIERAVDDLRPALSGATRAALEPVLYRTAEWIESAGIR